MRPTTLAEVGNRLSAGETSAKVLAEFLDEFYASGTLEAAAAMLQQEPRLTGQEFPDALLAAIADYLSMQYFRQPPPAWARAPGRFLDRPAFTTPVDTPAAKAWLMHSSPAEFKFHNIFTEARPLRRKLSDRPRWTQNPPTGTAAPVRP
jgi:hypothetical protein